MKKDYFTGTKTKISYWTFIGFLAIVGFIGCANVPGDKTPQIVSTIKTGVETAVYESLVLAKHYKPELVAPVQFNLEYAEAEFTVLLNSGKIDAPTVSKILTDTFNQINKQVAVLPFDIALVITTGLNAAANLANVYLDSETVPANVQAYAGAIQAGIQAGLSDFATNPMLHKPVKDGVK